VLSVCVRVRVWTVCVLSASAGASVESVFELSVCLLNVCVACVC